MARRRLSLRVRAAIVFIGVGLTLFFAPAVIGRYMPGWVADQAFPRLAGRLRVARWTLSWTRALEAENVQLLDDQGNVVARADRISTDYSLAHWLSRPTRLGKLQLASLELKLVLDERGWNLVRALEPLLSEPSGAVVEQFTVELRDGSLSLDNVQTGRKMECSGLRGVFRWQGGAESVKSPALLELAGKLAREDTTVPWSLKAKGESNAKLASLDQLVWTLRLEQLPLEMLETALPTEVGLGGELAGAVSWDAETIEWHELVWTSPAGRVALKGKTPLQLLRTPPAWWDFRGPLELRWEVEFAELWPRLKTLLDDPPGVLESGRLTGELSWTEENGQPHISGDLHADDVVTRIADRRSEWSTPVDVEWRVNLARRTFDVQQLTAKAPFIDVATQGNPSRATLTASIDLDVFQELLGSVVLPPAVRVGGKASVTGSWQRSASEFSGSLQWEGNGVGVATGPGRELREDRLDGSVTWECQFADDGTTDIRAARCRVSAGGDQVVASLRQATSWRGGSTHWPLQVHFEGDLHRWALRVRPWLAAGTDDVRLPRGTLHGDATILVTPEAIEIAQASAGGEELRWAPLAAEWYEPVWRLTLDDGRWSFSGPLDAGKLVVQSTTVAASLIQFHAPALADPSAMTGKALVRGDLSRLQHLITVWGLEPLPVELAGELVANVLAERLEEQANQWTGKWTVRSLRVDNRGVPASRGTANRPLFAASQLNGSGQVSWNGENTLQVTKWRTELPAALVLDVAGSCELGRPQRPFTLKGTVAYDWEELQRVWPAAWQVNLRGRGEESIEVRGVIPGDGDWSASVRRDWMALAGISWDELRARQIVVGPAQTKVGYQRSMLTAERLDTTLSTGRITLRPWLDWRSDPAVLRLDPPTRVSNARLTPEMCRGWLQYAIPLLAKAAEAEGEFSAEAGEFSWPLGDPQQARANGTVSVRRGRVGPSDEMRKMLAVLDIAAKLNGRGGVNPNEKKWLELPQQTVRWKLERGRVHHDALTMKIGELQLTSRGSVGLDESLDVVLALKIPEQWLAGQPLLASLRGQTLIFPVQGTLDQPKMSSDALKSITDRVLQGSTEELLRQGLRGLFGN